MVDVSGGKGQPAYLTADGFRAARERVAEALETFHAEHPLRLGVGRIELRNRTGLPDGTLGRALDEGIAADEVQEVAAGYAAAGHAPEPDEAAAGFVERVRAYREAGWTTPTLAQAIERVAEELDPVAANDLCANLLDEGTLVAVGDELVFHRERYDEARERVRTTIRESAPGGRHVQGTARLQPALHDPAPGALRRDRPDPTRGRPARPAGGPKVNDPTPSNGPAAQATPRFPLGLVISTSLAVAATTGAAVLWVQSRQQPELQVVGPEIAIPLPEFTFTDRTGAPFGSADLRGKVWVADFVFTRCESICPKLSDGLAKLQQELATHPARTRSGWSASRSTPSTTARRC